MQAGLGNSFLQYTYDDLGQRTSATVSNHNGTVLWLETYGYDNRNRLTSKASSAGTLTYSYDAASNLASTTSSTAGGIANTHTYDALNWLDTIAAPLLSPNPTSYTYDPNGNLVSSTYPNGVTHTYTYDTLNRLQTLGVTRSGTGDSSVVLQGYGYTLNNAGHRTTIMESNGRVSNYTYDATYKLLSESISGTVSINDASTFTYDQVGNRLSLTTNIPGLSNQTFTYTDNDWLGGETMDANGNTVSSPLTLNGTDLYDFEDKLVRRTKQDGPVIDLLYNADGDRVEKTITEPGQPTLTDTYHVDRNNHTGYAQVVEEFTSEGLILYTYGHDLIAQTDNGAETTSYYTYDGLGTVRGLTNMVGTLTDTYDYDAWGNVIARTGTTPNLYLFTGEQYDPDLGMYYLRARYMNPGTGRFWNMDTYEGRPSEPLSLHKYLYGNGNPLSNIDPSGKVSLLEAQVVGAIRNLTISEISYNTIDLGYRASGSATLYNTLLLIRAYQFAQITIAAPSLIRVCPRSVRF